MDRTLPTLRLYFAFSFLKDKIDFPVPRQTHKKILTKDFIFSVADFSISKLAEILMLPMKAGFHGFPHFSEGQMFLCV